MAEIIKLETINTQPLEEEFGKLKTDEIIVTDERIEHIKTHHPEDYELFKAIPHKARLTAWRHICLRVFRHLAQKSLDIRQYACGISVRSDEKPDGASAPPALCGIALKS